LTKQPYDIKINVCSTNNLYSDYYLLLGNKLSVVRSPQEVMRGYFIVHFDQGRPLRRREVRHYATQL